MGWAGGARLAEEVWDIVRGFIPKEKRTETAIRIIEAFRDEDWDTVDEAETLATDAGWYNEEEYAKKCDALCAATDAATDAGDQEEADLNSGGHRVSGRQKPYTEIGIRRLKCVRCGKPALHQWKACADGPWRPICRECDISLNRIALMFMFPDDSDGNDNKIKRYITSYR